MAAEGLRAVFDCAALAMRYFGLRGDERTRRQKHLSSRHTRVLVGHRLPKAASRSHRGMVDEPSPIRVSLCPCSDDQVSYNVREQSISRPGSRYKYLLWTDLQTKNRLSTLASRHCSSCPSTSKNRAETPKLRRSRGV